MRIADNTSASVPSDLARRLGSEGIRQLLKIMVDAYRDLYKRQWVRADSPEDSITEEWFVCIQKRWKPDNAYGLIPVPQKQDTGQAKTRGRPPTIDFCFRDGLSSQSYFGAECKLLDQGSSRHLKAYMDDTEGIGRFLSGKYAACTGAGAMVGYVRRGDCHVVAGELAKGIEQLAGKPKLLKSQPVESFEQLYESKHTRREGVSPFVCFHLLLAFNCSLS
jgi:hypothetical protein